MGSSGELLRRLIAIPANSVVNIFAGELVERFPVNLFGQFGIQGSAVGLEYDLTLGGDQVAIQQEIDTQNRFPTFPNEFDFINGQVFAGALNRCAVRNTTGGALNVFVVFRGTLDKLAST